MPDPTNQDARSPTSRPARRSPPTTPAPTDEVTEINPDVDITPEDIGVPVVAEGERLLEVDAVTLRFGGVVALDEVSFHINKGEILGLIGPNGAGKTTCFNVMTGVYQPTSGCGAATSASRWASATSTRSPSWASRARSRTSGSSPT